MRRRCGQRRRRSPQGRLTRVGATGALLLMAVAILGYGMVVRATPLVVDLRDAVGLADGPVYAVGQLRAEVALQPGAWLGRTVWVRAVASHVRVTYCPYPGASCMGEVPVLAAADGPRMASLPLVWGLSNPVRARLRQLPLLARFVPPQAPQWGRPATYRVALRLLPGPPCPTCYAAVLLDASPVAGL